jgi:hypothetical protein
VFDSAILDVAIGMAFIFLLVSLLVSAATEMLAGWLKWRSRHLWEGLEQLLQSAEARAEVYNHPLIKGLARVNVGAPDWKDGRSGPSYIPSRTFALAVIDVLRRPHKLLDDFGDRLQKAVSAAADPTKVFDAFEQIAQEMLASGISQTVKTEVHALRARLLPPVDATVAANLKRQVEAVLTRLPQAERTVAGTKVTEWVEQQADKAATYVDLRATLTDAIGSIPFVGSLSSAEQLRTALDGVIQQFPYGTPEEAMREIEAFAKESAKRWLQDASTSLQGTVAALSPLLHDAADDVDRFRENIEIWFNDGMDRVSGWYKRHIAYVQGAIALGLAIAMNIDALQITRTLWREPTLRQTLVANAQQFADERTAEVVDPDRKSDASANGKTLSVAVDQVRLVPGDVARFDIQLADPATKDAKVTVKRLTPAVLLSWQNKDFAAEDLTLQPGENSTSAQFFARAMPVTGLTPVQLVVAAGGLEVTASVVVQPQGDQRFAAVREQIGTLGLPIGWSCPSDAKLTPDPTAIGGPFWCSTPPGNSGRRWTSLSWWAIWFKDVLAMIFGWLITAAAASLGAPFWFDSLKRVISIRSSGKAPEERPLSPKEVPQPREPGQRPKEADLVNALKGQ